MSLKRDESKRYNPPLCLAVSQRLSFLVCGAQKSGTTALAAYLRQHPGIYLPEVKELHFFDDDTVLAESKPELISSPFSGRRR